MIDDRDLTWGLPEGFEPSSEYARGGIVIRPIDAEMEVGELIVPADDLRRLLRITENKELPRGGTTFGGTHERIL